ncbi:MAG: hypothetical protein [Bacteriophage sp.]|nr:MAG: hypothetical protein [Bacteriophage sp.]
MTQNLPDAPVPRRKQILPEGVIRAKDNVDDFSFSQKSRQSEAEHNMGYYLAELNNRNQELENLVERQDKDLAALRRENAELRERSMKVVTAAVPPALPDFSHASRIHQQRLLLEHKDAEINDLRERSEYRERESDDLRKINTSLRDENNDLRGKYSDVTQQRNTARDELRTLTARMEMTTVSLREYTVELNDMTASRNNWRGVTTILGVFVIACLGISLLA